VGERMKEAGDDPFRRVGKRAVEIEDHQLRARDSACHLTIVLDGKILVRRCSSRALKAAH